MPKNWTIADIMEDTRLQEEAENRTLGLAAAKEMRLRRNAQMREDDERRRTTEQKEREAQEERDRFFNQPPAEADLEHWGKLDLWSLDEAVALSLGKAPEAVNSQSIEPFVAKSPFAQGYNKRLDMARRAAERGVLKNPSVPADFLSWARHKGFELPRSLRHHVFVHGDDLHERLLAARAQMKELEGDLTRSNEIRDQLRADISALTGKLDAAEKALQCDPLRPKERNSLLLLMATAIAVAYNSDPRVDRTDLFSEIQQDLDRLGASIHTDTVRKWVKAAFDLFDREHLDEFFGGKSRNQSTRP